MIRRIIILLITAALLLSFTACNRGGKKRDTGNLFDVSEPEPGDIYAEIKFLGYDEVVIFKLFPELAPQAVEEFSTRAERGYYDRKNIHRVIQNYIIQGGSVNFDGSDGNVESGELFPIETSPNARNFYGALCLVADSRGQNYVQFFVVTNKNPVDIDAEIEIAEGLLKGEQGTLNEDAKNRIQSNLDIMKAIPQNIKEQYLARGGVPEFDGLVSVFGQLVSGGDVLDAIAGVLVAAGNEEDDKQDIRSKPVEEIIIERITIVRIPLEEDEPEETTSPPRRGGAQTTTTTASEEIPPATEPQISNTDLLELPPVLDFENNTEPELGAEIQPEPTPEPELENDGG
ncbi:MAG: peptidylprolyl isomerase [Oscillospiraceae bacterium]|nr:peptidylprolyl isomerase [Oscillospiraceae bacterium]